LHVPRFTFFVPRFFLVYSGPQFVAATAVAAVGPQPIKFALPN
jgi:hypothetical protein